MLPLPLLRLGQAYYLLRLICFHPILPSGQPLTSTALTSLNFASLIHHQLTFAWALITLNYCFVFRSPALWTKSDAPMTKLLTRSASSKTTRMLMRLAEPTVLNIQLRTATAALLQRLAKSSFLSKRPSFQQIRNIFKSKP